MNEQLVTLLQGNLYQPLTTELASKIYELSRRVQVLVPQAQIEAIEPEQCGEFTFAREWLRDILAEIHPIHEAHWQETEAHRHGLTLKPDYDRLMLHENAGRYIIFTLRKDGRLLGNFSVYVAQSIHTQTLLSTEDTLFLLPEARKGRTAARFIAYGERGLKQLGVKEINVSVKLVNKAGRYFQIIGYRHVANGLTKVLED